MAVGTCWNIHKHRATWGRCVDGLMEDEVLMRNVVVGNLGQVRVGTVWRDAVVMTCSKGVVGCDMWVGGRDANVQRPDVYGRHRNFTQ